MPSGHTQVFGVYKVCVLLSIGDSRGLRDCHVKILGNTEGGGIDVRSVSVYNYLQPTPR